MLDITIINCLSDNYSYLIRDKKTSLVGVVDPSDFNTIDKEISKTYKKLDFILNTHHHTDHVGGNIDLKKKYNPKVICSSYEEKKIPGAWSWFRILAHAAPMAEGRQIPVNVQVGDSSVKATIKLLGPQNPFDLTLYSRYQPPGTI